jgi:hypothetical protein
MNRAHRAAGFALVVLVTAAVNGSTARADASADAESAMQRGIGLRRLGKNREALEAFEQAYGLSPTLRGEAQIALAHQALGDWVDAEEGLQRALATEDDPWIARYRNFLEEALTTVRAHLGWLDVTADVARGELVIDGTSRHDLPSPEPVRVAAGAVDFEVRAPDRVQVHRTVDVAPGAHVQVAVALEPVPASVPVATAGLPLSQGPAQTADVPRANAPFRVGDALPFAAAVVFAGAGVVAWRVREDQVAIFNDDARCLTGTLSREQQCGGHAHAANVALGFEIGGLAAAGLSAAFGAWRLWFSGARSSTVARSSCTPWGGLGVACGGRF